MPSKRTRSVKNRSSIDSFGAFFAAQRRARSEFSLREFALRNGLDAGNLSRLERGLSPAPSGREILERYAEALGIPAGSDDWYKFFDLAASERGRLPVDLASRGDVLPKLPIMFRALRNGSDSLTPEEVESLIETLRRS